MVDGKVDTIMMLKVVRQVVETLQGLHTAGINHHVTYRNVNVDTSRGYVRVTLTNLRLDSSKRTVANDMWNVGVFIASCEARGVDVGASLR